MDAAPVAGARPRRVDTRRVLASLPAPGEERLERLRGELDHAAALDPARPPALKVRAFRRKHSRTRRLASAATTAPVRHASGPARTLRALLGSYRLGAHACGAPRSVPPASARAPSEPSRTASSVSMKRTSLGGSPDQLADDPRDCAGRPRPGALRAGLAKRLEVRLDGDDCRNRLRNRPRPATRPRAPRTAGAPRRRGGPDLHAPPFTVTRRLCTSDSRDTERGSQDALAAAPPVRGSTWTTTSLSAARPAPRSTRSAAACPARPRRAGGRR